MRFSVLSYNILHSAGAARLLRGRQGSHGWSKDRLHRAAELVAQLAPSVACLQEVDPAAEDALCRVLGDRGYELAALHRNEELPPKDGCAIFVRKAQFEVERSHCFRLRDTAERHFPASANIRSETAGLAAALWRELHEKLSIAAALELKTTCTTGGTAARKLCVATSHLFWDPRYPDLKLLQAFLLAQELETLTGPDCKPVVLAGDLNSTPLADGRSSGEGELSGVYGLLTQGAVDVSHSHHPVLLRRGAGILKGVLPKDVPKLRVSPFRSAFCDTGGQESKVTNVSKDFRGCLDYILYRGPGLHAVASGTSPAPLPPEQADCLLPSEDHPSDHLPIWAEFKLD